MRHAGLAQGAARAQCRRAGCRGQGEEAGHACVANVTKFAQVKTTQPDEPAEPPRPALQMPDCDKLSARRLQPAQGCAAAAALAKIQIVAGDLGEAAQVHKVIPNLEAVDERQLARAHKVATCAGDAPPLPKKRSLRSPQIQASQHRKQLGCTMATPGP